MLVHLSQTFIRQKSSMCSLKRFLFFFRPPRYVRDLIDAEKLTSFSRLRCLAKFGDDVTSDHISPAGSIVRNSPAADYLANQVKKIKETDEDN